MTDQAALVERIVAALRSGDHATLATLYRPDALLDVNVPEWRYQLQGPAAILAQLREEASPAGRRLGAWRATPTDDGVVVETEVRFDRDGEQHLWRDAHVVHTDGRRISEHVVYCTGIWDGATIDPQVDEAPMVRP